MCAPRVPFEPMKAIVSAALVLLVVGTAHAQPVQVHGDKVVLVNDDKTFTITLFASTAHALVNHAPDLLPTEYEALGEAKAKKDKQPHRARLTATGCTDQHGKLKIHMDGVYAGEYDWAAAGSRMYDAMAVAVCALAMKEKQ